MLVTKLSILPFFRILYLIASPLPTIGLLLPIHFPQHHNPLGSNEAQPLLRFSFAKFLANPCGLNYNGINAPVSVVDDDSKGVERNNPVTGPPSIIASYGDDMNGTSSPSPLPQDLSKEALQLLDSLRHQYNVNHSPFSSEELVVTIDEFFLILQEVKDHIKVLNSMSSVECESSQLESLPKIEQMIDEYDEPDIKEIYRALALTSAHLHLMTRHHFSVFYDDQEDSAPRFRPCRSMENLFYQQNVRVFTGKVERLMCLIFPMRISRSSYYSPTASLTDKTNPHSDDLFQVIHNVLQTHIHHTYRDCSAREMHRCLIVRYAQRVFEMAHKLGLSQRRRLEHLREEEYRTKFCATELSTIQSTPIEKKYFKELTKRRRRTAKTLTK